MCSPLNVCKLCCQAQSLYCNYFFLPLYSSETVNLARPFARRAANTRRPFFVAILSRKPCLFFLFLLEGWNVLFIVLYILYCLYSLFRLFAFQLAKLLFFFILAKFSRGIFFSFLYYCRDCLICCVVSAFENVQEWAGVAMELCVLSIMRHHFVCFLACILLCSAFHGLVIKKYYI